MSHADQVIKEALVQGTAQAVPDMEATWRQVNRRIAAGRLRTRILRSVAAAVAGLTLVTVAVPSLRAAAGGFWMEVVTFSQGASSYAVVAPVLPPPNVVMQSGTVTTTSGGSETITLATLPSTTATAPAGELPALTGLLIPARTPAPVPQAPVTVTTTVNAREGATIGSQMVRMAWDDGTVVQQQTSLARPSADAAWAVANPARQTLLPAFGPGQTPEERKLTESVSALRTAANDHVFYYFSDGGTDFIVSGPAAQEEMLLEMARSLLQ
jgi:hypothetical protein